MKLRNMKTGEDFLADLISAEIPAHIAGSPALKRRDTGEYIGLKEVIGFDSPIGIIEISAEETKLMDEAGLMFAPHLPPGLTWQDVQRIEAQRAAGLRKLKRMKRRHK